MRALPTGAVTFLFTDIEGSTRLLHQLGDAYADVLATQRRLLREAFAAHGGVEVDTQGDAFFVAFRSAPAAVAAASDGQRALAGTPVRVRMGIHTGTPFVTPEGYVGLDVHRGARICAAGHGGQILLSKTTRDLLDATADLRDLGEHRLKDLPHPEWLYQVRTPGLDLDFPPLRTLSNTNLPAEVSSLVGREREVAELTDLLADPDVRLVTLTGPGGTGKTRLAIRLGSQLVETFRNGVFLVSLAPVADPALVLATVANTLGIVETSGRALLDSLRGYLRGRSMLLLLDNFEHLMAAGPDIAQLLALEPQLKIVATSREPLRITGEHERVVDPLIAADAVALFEERARAVDAGFAIAECRDSVARICAELDHLPLAIELAAARIKHLSPQDLLARLDHRLATLTYAPRDRPERQRTLRAAIGWSHDLLDERERMVFARLSLFAGGCTAEAAAAVCDADEDAIAALVDKSLLRRDGHRYRMLETIREYAAERLAASGENETMTHRYAVHYLELAQRGATFYAVPEQITWSARLEDENDNFRAVLTRALEGGDTETALRMGTALWRSWMSHGRLAEGRRWLELALSQSSAGVERANALVGAGTLAVLQGDTVRARDHFTEALALYRNAGDEWGVGRSLWGLAVAVPGYDAALPYLEEAVAIQRRLNDSEGSARSLLTLGGFCLVKGDNAQARSAFESALALSRAVGDRHGIAGALGGLGDLARRGSDLAAARRYYGEALVLRREVGERAGVAGTLFFLGLIARDEGDRAGARSFQEESLQIAREIGVTERVAEALGQLARLAADDGDYDRARSLLEEALAATESPSARAIVLSELGDVAHLEGNDAEAAKLQRESLALWRSLGATAFAVRGLERLAAAMASTSEAATACRVLGAADAARRKMGAPRPPVQQPAVERCIATLRAALGTAFEVNWAEGRGMTIEAAVDYALTG